MTLPSGIYQLMAPRAHKTRSINITEKEFTNLIEALKNFLSIVLDISTYKTCLLEVLLGITKPSRDVSAKISPVARLTKLLRQIDEVTNISIHKNIAKPASLDKRSITLDDLTELFTKEELLEKAGWTTFISNDGDNIMYVGEKTLMHDTLVQTSQGSVELNHGEKTLGQMESDDVTPESTDLAGKKKNSDENTDTNEKIVIDDDDDDDDEDFRQRRRL